MRNDGVELKDGKLNWSGDLLLAALFKTNGIKVTMTGPDTFSAPAADAWPLYLGKAGAVISYQAFTDARMTLTDEAIRIQLARPKV